MTGLLPAAAGSCLSSLAAHQTGKVHAQLLLAAGSAPPPPEKQMSESVGQLTLKLTLSTN